ncbi:MAG: class I SAM-dependent DNA methyltransferase, partial [Candidatus Muirbacterium halophilum]|nr:class I SAM-dependent DNA methyltransferase [Candidatus Muirbacterium halophilum]
WDVNINYGIKTGLNEAFIIDTPTKERLCAEDPKSAEILKPILRGRDIKRYSYEWAGLWIIATFPVLHIDIDQYPAVKKYLLDFGKERLEQEGNTLPDGTISRKKTGNKWFETQDQIGYYKEFEKEKIMYSEIVQKPQFYLDKEGLYYSEATSFLITGSNLKFLLGVLNSNSFTLFFKSWYSGGGLGNNGYRYKKAFLELTPIPLISGYNQLIVHQIETFVNEILSLKKGNIKADTSNQEKQIDQLVYRLYELTEEEIEFIEKG